MFVTLVLLACGVCVAAYRDSRRGNMGPGEWFCFGLILFVLGALAWSAIGVA